MFNFLKDSFLFCNINVFAVKYKCLYILFENIKREFYTVHFSICILVYILKTYFVLHEYCEHNTLIYKLVIDIILQIILFSTSRFLVKLYKQKCIF